MEVYVISCRDIYGIPKRDIFDNMVFETEKLAKKCLKKYGFYKDTRLLEEVWRYPYSFFEYYYIEPRRFIEK